MIGSKTKYYTFAEDVPFELVSGKKLKSITLAYETYGTLNENKTNAVILEHALTGSAHASSCDSDPIPGWWDDYVGPGKAFDTNKYFFICSNILGGCYGSTGPSSIDPNTGEPYGLTFPMVTIRDMVTAQRELVKYLGITKLLAVAGGSMGGFQALEWALCFPEMVNAVIGLATSHSQSAQGIAFNEVGRQAIYQDVNWNKGNYYKENKPMTGLALARMIAHITYLSEQKMHEKFGRNLQDNKLLSFNLDMEFQVESYLRYQGNKFVSRFDANTYLYLSKALDYFDIRNDHGKGNLVQAFEKVQSNFLLISFSSDWLYSPDQMKEIINALRINGKNVVYLDIDTNNGHDAFLLPDEILNETLANFLKREYIKLNDMDS